VQDAFPETADVTAELATDDGPDRGDAGDAGWHAGSTDERRQHRRFSLGVPVRLRALGSDASMMVELSDVSFRGCRLCTLSEAPPPELDTAIAFGFVLPGRKIALVKGRVVRNGDWGVGVAIDRANVTFYEFLMTLAEGDRDLSGATPAPHLAAG